MAENKKTFIFYSDWINMIREMPNSDAGELLKHVLAYVNDETPTTDNILVRMAFGHMQPMIKADLVKWDDIRKQRAEYGKKGGQAKAKHKLSKPKQVEAVNENVNVIENENKEKSLYVDFLQKFNQITNRKFRVLDSKTKRQLNARIKEGFTIEEIFTAAENCKKDEYHIQNPKYLTPEFITRTDKLQKYLHEPGQERRFDQKFRTTEEREQFIAGRVKEIRY